MIQDLLTIASALPLATLLGLFVLDVSTRIERAIARTPKPPRLNFPNSPLKNCLEIEPQPAQKPIDDESPQRATEQPLKPNYSEYSLKQLRTECRMRGITPTGDLRRRDSWIAALN